MANLIGLYQAALLDPNLMLTQIVLPFLLIFVILWGALNLTRMFGLGPDARKIYIVLALVITIFTAFTDAWGLIATQLAVATGVLAYVMFFAVFIIAIIIWAIQRTRGVYDMHSVSGVKSYNDLKKIDKELGKLKKRWKEIQYSKPDEADAILTTIGALEEKKKLLIIGKGMH